MRMSIGWKHKQALCAYLILLPGALYFSVYFFYPIGLELWASFFSGQPLLGASEFIGFGNYVEAFSDKVAIRSFRLTMVFSVTGTVLTLLISIGLAAVLAGPTRMNNAIRAIIFFPYITSFVIVALMWKSILDPYSGILNSVLLQLGMPTQNWLAHPDTALITIICITVWKDIGYAMLIYIAAIQGIPSDYYDAASLDGVTPGQQFRHITVPLIAPTTLFLAVVSMIGHLQDLAAPYLLTNGGPANSTRLFSLHIFEVAFRELNIGYASALSFIMFVAILLITLFQFRILDRKIDY